MRYHPGLPSSPNIPVLKSSDPQPYLSDLVLKNPKTAQDFSPFVSPTLRGSLAVGLPRQCAAMLYNPFPRRVIPNCQLASFAA
jgi:hypothetical protein